MKSIPLLVFCAVFGSLPVCLAGEGNAAPPNIIFIMSDDHAAHAIGAECLAVATGGFTIEQLREAGGLHVFASLAAPGAMEALFALT